METSLIESISKRDNKNFLHKVLSITSKCNIQEDEAIAKTLRKCKTTFLSFLEKFSLTTVFEVYEKIEKKSLWKNLYEKISNSYFLFTIHFNLTMLSKFVCCHAIALKHICHTKSHRSEFWHHFRAMKINALISTNLRIKQCDKI